MTHKQAVELASKRVGEIGREYDASVKRLLEEKNVRVTRAYAWLDSKAYKKRNKQDCWVAGSSMLLDAHHAASKP